jgi:hypothetical protein
VSQQDKLSAAISVLQQAVQRGLCDPAAYNDLGLMLLACPRLAETVDSFERATTALDPGFRQAR